MTHAVPTRARASSGRRGRAAMRHGPVGIGAAAVGRARPAWARPAWARPVGAREADYVLPEPAPGGAAGAGVTRGARRIPSFGRVIRDSQSRHLENDTKTPAGERQALLSAPPAGVLPKYDLVI